MALLVDFVVQIAAYVDERVCLGSAIVFAPLLREDTCSHGGKEAWRILIEPLNLIISDHKICAT